MIQNPQAMAQALRAPPQQALPGAAPDMPPPGPPPGGAAPPPQAAPGGAMPPPQATTQLPAGPLSPQGLQPKPNPSEVLRQQIAQAMAQGQLTGGSDAY